MATAAVSAEDDLSCPICFELFVDPCTPKNLPLCGHVICEVCLKKMMEGQCQRKCPECRKVIKIPSNRIASFTTNYRLRSLAENHQKAGNDLPQNKVSPKKSGVPLCPDHEDEKMHYYCVTCNSLACQVCMNLKHKTGHYIEGVKEICSKQKTELKSIIDQAKSRIKEAKDVLSECKADETGNGELHDTVEKQVDKFTEMHVNEILEQCKDFKNEIKSSKEFHESQLKRRTCSVEKLINSFKTSYQEAVSVSNLPDHEYVTQHALFVKKMEETYMSKPRTLAGINTKQDVIKFVPTSSDTKLGHIISATPGKVRTLKHTQTLCGLHCAKRCDCTSDGMLAIIYKMKVVIYHKVNGKYEKKFDLKLTCTPNDIAICPDGKFIVAGGICIEVYSHDGTHQNDIEIKGSGKVNVNYVKVTSDGKILVGDYCRSLIVEINPTGDVIRTIQTNMKPDHMILIHDTHIVISNRCDGKVIVIDIQSGQETLSIDIYGVTGICYDEYTECLLTASNNYKPGFLPFNTGVIEQYSYTTGRLIACLQQGLYHPSGMALTSDRHLIVANDGTVEIYKIQ